MQVCTNLVAIKSDNSPGAVKPNFASSTWKLGLENDNAIGAVAGHQNVPAYFQSDLNLSYDLGSDSQVTTFVNVANLFNAKGGIYQTSGFTGSISLRYPNMAYANAIGRYFTAGVRFKS